MDKKPTIIITGASGFIGSELVKYYNHLQWKVIAFVRRFPKEPSNIRYLQFDLENFSEEIFSVEKADFLIHAAYAKHEDNSNADRINLEGTNKIIDGCRKSGIHLLFLSSFSAHDQATSHYGKTKLHAETLFDLNRDIILKVGLVLGAGGGLFVKMAEAIKRSKLIPLIGKGKQPVQTISIDDLCRITETCLKNNLYGSFKVAEPNAFPIKKLYALIAKKLGRKIIFIPAPAGLIYLICKIAEWVQIKLPVSAENVLGLKNLRSFETKGDLERLNVSIKDAGSTIEKINYN